MNYVLARIQAIQQDLEELRKFLAHNIEKPECQVKKTKLRGLWKGIDVTEKDLEEAKQSVFRDAYEFKEQR
jgi:hypothetical protein